MVKKLTKIKAWMYQDWKIVICICALALVLATMITGVCIHVHEHNVQRARIEQAEHMPKTLVRGEKK